MLRWGLTFTNQTACRWKIKRNGVANTTTCPLCPGQDGCSHMFGGCQHPNMKAHYISRHNRAARVLFDAIQRGNLGGSFCMWDESKYKSLPDVVSGVRPPIWMLPHITKDTRDKMRPDMLLVEGLSTKDAERFDLLTSAKQT